VELSDVQICDDSKIKTEEIDETVVLRIAQTSGYSLEQWGRWFACTQRTVPNVVNKCLWTAKD